MEQKVESTAQSVIADYFSNGYRLSGSFDISTKTLADTLYDINTDYMTIQNAYLSPVTSPAQILSYHPSTVLYKRNLDFILALEQSTGLRVDMRYRLPPYPHTVFIIIPMFIIYGTINTHQRHLDPRFFLSNDAGTFITVLDVKAHCTYNPEVVYNGASALVSRSQISFLGRHETEQ